MPSRSSILSRAFERIGTWYIRPELYLANLQGSSRTGSINTVPRSMPHGQCCSAPDGQRQIPSEWELIAPTNASHSHEVQSSPPPRQKVVERKRSVCGEGTKNQPLCKIKRRAHLFRREELTHIAPPSQYRTLARDEINLMWRLWSVSFRISSDSALRHCLREKIKECVTIRSLSILMQ